MEKPSRTTRKRIAINSDDSDEDFTPKKKTTKVTKTTTEKGEKMTRKRIAKDEGISTVKRKTTSSKKVKESKVENETSEGDGQIQTKPSSANIPLETKALVKNLVENSYDVVHNMWDESEMLSHVEKVPLGLARNFIALLTEGCTLPFIARYRKANVDHLMPDR